MFCYNMAKKGRNQVPLTARGSCPVRNCAFPVSSVLYSSKVEFKFGVFLLVCVCHVMFTVDRGIIKQNRELLV